MPELIWLLIAIVLVMGLAYFATRFVGGNMLARGSRKTHGKMLRSVEQMYLGRDRQIILVQVGERYFLLGNTANQITNLAELSAEEVEAWREKERQTGEEGQRMSFTQALQEILKKRGESDSSD